MLLAQRIAPAWGGGADQKDFSFGFQFSYVNNTYKIEKKPGWRSPYFDAGTNKYITDSLNSISSGSTPGFALGFLARYTVTEHFEIRATPSLIFADRAITYTYDTPSQNVTKQVQATSVEFPLEVKIKSDRIEDFRAYLIGGLKYTKAIGRGNTQVTLDPLQRTIKNVSGFGSYEVGIGCDIYFEYFKLSPEIKLSNSFGNVLVAENQPFASPLNKLFLRTLAFSLYFE